MLIPYVRMCWDPCAVLSLKMKPKGKGIGENHKQQHMARKRQGTQNKRELSVYRGSGFRFEMR